MILGTRRSAMTNFEIVDVISPWYEVFACVFRTADSDVRAVVSGIGVPRRTERANIYHLCIREGMRVLADRYDPVLTLVEEPEGQGLDYVVLHVGDHQIGIRWPKWNGVQINRNDSNRTREIQDQGCFPFYMETHAGLDTVAVAYVLQDDYTEGGRPCWWTSRLVLLREKSFGDEFIDEVARFAQPDVSAVELESHDGPRIVVRNGERRRMIELGDVVFRKVG